MREGEGDEGQSPTEPPKGDPAGARLGALVLAKGQDSGEQLVDPEAIHSALTESRLSVIEDDMRRNRFVRGRSVRAYAELWGLSHQRVRELTAIASRRVLADVADPEGVTRDVSVALRRTIRKASREGDHKAVIAASKALAQITGAMAPKLVKALVGHIDATGGGEGGRRRPMIYVPAERDD
jgi:hypothetical protein